MEQLISGIVGPEAAASFLGWTRSYNISIPGAEQTLENFESQKELFEDLLKENRIDVLNLVLKNIVAKLELKDLHYQNLNALLEFLPQEFSIMFFKYFITKRIGDYDTLSSSLPVFDKVADSIIDFIAS